MFDAATLVALQLPVAKRPLPAVGRFTIQRASAAAPQKCCIACERKPVGLSLHATLFVPVWMLNTSAIPLTVSTSTSEVGWLHNLDNARPSVSRCMCVCSVRQYACIPAGLPLEDTDTFQEQEQYDPTTTSWLAVAQPGCVAAWLTV